MRSLSTSVLLVLAAGALLSGCAPAENSYEGCTPEFPIGSSADVEVSGEFGSSPDVEFATPFVTDGTSARYIDRSGDPIERGDFVEAAYSVFSARTGQLVLTTYDASGDGQTLQVTAGNGTPIGDALVCATEGSRVVTTATVDEVFGAGTTDPNVGILTSSDTVVLVLDVIQAFPGRAEGWPMPAVDGLPAVAIAPDGTPGLTFPSGDAPQDLTIATTIQGNGPVVEDGATVLVHYTGVVWESGAVFDSSWQNGIPATFTLGDGMIEGFNQAIIDQTVGSQVVVSIPQELGYNDPQTRPATIPEGAHLVFVVDILGVIGDE